MYHFFDIELAQKYGCNEAIVLTNILYWLKHNYENGKNIYDGRVWTYNSRKAFSGLFPYWSDKQIYRIIQSLIEQGAILTGNYNEDKRDRTMWYSVNDDLMESCIIPKGTIHCPEAESPLSEMGQCIYKETNNKQQIINTNKNINPPIIPLKGESPRKPERADYRKMAKDFCATIPEADWREIVSEFLDYKCDIKAPLKCQRSLNAFLSNLKRDSGGNVERARAFLSKAIAKGWQSYHPDAEMSLFEQKREAEKKEKELKAAQEREKWILEREAREREEAERALKQAEAKAENARKLAAAQEAQRAYEEEEARRKAALEQYAKDNDLPF